MRIGLIAPPWVPVPPPAYGGTEVVVDNLARGLAARGHDVQLFTVGESTTPVHRRSLYPVAAEPMGDSLLEAAHVLAAYEELSDADIIHDHTMLGPLLATHRRLGSPPVVTTHHGPFTPVSRRVFREIARHTAVVAVSHAQALAAGDIPIAAVVHHGIDLDLYRAGPGGGGYLLFVGRMCADKGVHRAVRIAKRAGRTLIMATKIRERAEQEYFEREVRPLLSAGDDWPAEQPLPRRLELMRHADALVNPIGWPEPFGLVMAEALACATPVLAFSRGAAPEIVDHGRTGYLCEGDDEMAAALDRLGALDRARCRAAAEQRFSLERMVRDHEQVYRSILTRRFPAAERALRPLDAVPVLEA
ncbi:glycosyltransferase family 4 protein [Qaidamihabitans albus]|uniref:glycosyltransferase family 4 protein n=1 Tax=Qaidamihabitans albus TaxID=2795733 RepID=UPI0018F20099|nr:glycosyltransferase family 4 protein [Qaidamihabitans albus]